jgi:hypothetical protein
LLGTATRSAPGQGRTKGSIEVLPSGALRGAVYAGIDPVTNPDPPTPDEAAWILAEAWADPDWGTQLWVAMTTARRGRAAGTAPG